MGLNNPFKFAFQMQPLVDQDRNPPVMGTLYDLIIATGGVEVYLIAGWQSNNELNDKEIDLIITIDGEVYTYDASVVGDDFANGTEYFFPLYYAGPGTPFRPYLSTNARHGLSVEMGANLFGVPLKGHDIQIQYRMTSAAGTNQRLYFQCLHALKDLV